jgi:hypothetical protein
MKSAWSALRDAVEHLTDDSSAVVRLTDLAIAAAIARRSGLVKRPSTRASTGCALRLVIEEIALFPLPGLDDSLEAWRLVEDRANAAAELSLQVDAIDDWVESSQGADPHQKSRGAYATPRRLAHGLAQSTLAPFAERSVAPRIVDPAAGSGALLIAALRVLARDASPEKMLSIVYSLHGMELDPAAREQCCHLLWIAATPAKAELARIAANIVVGNAITHDWWRSGPCVFDALLMNPPWESLRQTVADNEPHARERVATVERLRLSEGGSDGLPPLFSNQGTGDRNLFKAFVELAPHLLRLGGRLGALIPAAFASDLGMSRLRRFYLEQFALERWTSFENLDRHFPIDGRYKFGLLTGSRSSGGTVAIRVRSFATDPSEVDAEHAIIDRPTLRRLGGRGHMLPELRSDAEAAILTQVFESGTPFFAGGIFGPVKYRREVDLTLDLALGLFSRFEDHVALRFAEDGTFETRAGERLVPLVEGRMVGQYDFFQKSWVSGRGRTARWIQNRNARLMDCRPQFVTSARELSTARIAICDVTSATNTRTVHATWVPTEWRCGNTAPVLEFETALQARAGLAVINSMVFDWTARRIVGGLHLNKFYLDSLMWPILDSGALHQLAVASDGLCALNPRFTPAGGAAAVPDQATEMPNKASFVDAHAQVELIVARGFGLGAEMLRSILADDRADRRGFWRYFAAEPRARAVAEKVAADAMLIDELV